MGVIVVILFFSLFFFCNCMPSIESIYNKGNPMKLTEKELQNWKILRRGLCTISLKKIATTYQMPAKKKGNETFQHIDIRKWPNATVPFVMSAYFAEKVRSEIFRAMERIENVSCVRFIDKTNDKTDKFHIKILPIWCPNGTSVGGLSTGYGYQPEKISKGVSAVFIDNNDKVVKQYYYLALHELYHILGFIHEFDRWDRNEYLVADARFHTITRPRVLLEDDPVAQFGFPYDYNSIMNYGGLKAKFPGIGTIKWPKELSNTDITELNLLYNCQTNL